MKGPHPLINYIISKLIGATNHHTMEFRHRNSYCLKHIGTEPVTEPPYEALETEHGVFQIYKYHEGKNQLLTTEGAMPMDEFVTRVCLDAIPPWKQTLFRWNLRRPSMMELIGDLVYDHRWLFIPLVAVLMFCIWTFTPVLKRGWEQHQSLRMPTPERIYVSRSDAEIIQIMEEGASRAHSGMKPLSPDNWDKTGQTPRETLVRVWNLRFSTEPVQTSIYGIVLNPWSERLNQEEMRAIVKQATGENIGAGIYNWAVVGETSIGSMVQNIMTLKGYEIEEIPRALFAVYPVINGKDVTKRGQLRSLLRGTGYQPVFRSGLKKRYMTKVSFVPESEIIEPDQVEIAFEHLSRHLDLPILPGVIQQPPPITDGWSWYVVSQPVEWLVAYLARNEADTIIDPLPDDIACLSWQGGSVYGGFQDNLSELMDNYGYEACFEYSEAGIRVRFKMHN